MQLWFGDRKHSLNMVVIRLEHGSVYVLKLQEFPFSWRKFALLALITVDPPPRPLSPVFQDEGDTEV